MDVYVSKRKIDKTMICRVFPNSFVISGEFKTFQRMIFHSIINLMDTFETICHKTFCFHVWHVVSELCGLAIEGINQIRLQYNSNCAQTIGKPLGLD